MTLYLINPKPDVVTCYQSTYNTFTNSQLLLLKVAYLLKNTQKFLVGILRQCRGSKYTRAFWVNLTLIEINLILHVV